MMENNTLAAARTAEQQPEVAGYVRPQFHLTPTMGWCNDPNGFCRFGGQYHLFYQYHPYSTQWGPMHWGHSVSADLLHWERRPCALAPDTAADAAGCFSGGAIEWEGRQLLLYTGVTRVNGQDVQQQCLATGDGVDYTKAAENPVIATADLPAGCAPADFRDPYLFTRDGVLYALIGARKQGQDGRLLLYKADASGRHWQFVRILIENDTALGSMWECPSLFEVDGQDLLMFSPQYMQATPDHRYHCGNNAVVLLGQWDGPQAPFVKTGDMPLDYGLDYYAPQVVKTPDGRTVSMAWMQSWDHCYPQGDAKWYGQMSLPRELHVRDKMLYQTPTREFDALRGQKTVHKNVALPQTPTALEGVRGRVLDLEMTLRPGKDCRRAAIRVACGKTHYTELRLDFEEGLLRVDRRCAGGFRDAAELCESPLVKGVENGSFAVRLVLDRFSAELFLQGGAQTAALTLYATPQQEDEIQFYAKGGCEMDLTAYEIRME